MNRRLVWSSLAVLQLGCLELAEPRAERDQTVGHEELESNRIDVDGGLAAIRKFEPGTLELWANAPALSARLTVADSAPREWSLVVRNVLPDAVVHARVDGVERFAAAEGSAFGTERRGVIEVGAAPRVELSVGPADADQAAPFDFIDFADVQTAIDRVGDIYAKMNQETSARFVMMPGDISEQGGESELVRFQDDQSQLALPIFVTLGNHELGSGTPAYYDYFGRGSESFSFHGVRFTLLDSASATIDPMVYDWFDGWAEAARDQVHFVFMHIPPLDPSGFRNGAFSSRAEADKLLARLGRARVDATFYGHIHSYYSFSNAGIPAFISGGGGAIPERLDGIGRHFLVVHVDPQAQTFSTRVVRVD